MSNPNKFLLLKTIPSQKGTLSKPESKLSMDSLVSESKDTTASAPSLRVGASRGRMAARKGGRRRKAGKSSAQLLPPPIETTMKQRHRFRFYASAAVSGASITPQILAGVAGGICTVTNSTITCWASSLRCRRITIWPAVGSAAGVGTSADITWAADGTLFSKDEYKVDALPQGITIDRPVSSVPPAGTLGKFWQAPSGTNTLATISAPSGSIVDIWVEFTLSNQNSSTSLTVATAVLGTIYYLSADGPGANKLVPLGLPTTH